MFLWPYLGDSCGVMLHFWANAECILSIEENILQVPALTNNNFCQLDPLYITARCFIIFRFQLSLFSVSSLFPGSHSKACPTLFPRRHAQRPSRNSPPPRALIRSFSEPLRTICTCCSCNKGLDGSRCSGHHTEVGEPHLFLVPSGNQT